MCHSFFFLRFFVAHAGFPSFLDWIEGYWASRRGMRRCDGPRNAPLFSQDRKKASFTSSFTRFISSVYSFLTELDLIRFFFGFQEFLWNWTVLLDSMRFYLAYKNRITEFRFIFHPFYFLGLFRFKLSSTWSYWIFLIRFFFGFQEFLWNWTILLGSMRFYLAYKNRITEFHFIFHLIYSFSTRFLEDFHELLWNWTRLLLDPIGLDWIVPSFASSLTRCSPFFLYNETLFYWVSLKFCRVFAKLFWTSGLTNSSLVDVGFCGLYGIRLFFLSVVVAFTNRNAAVTAAEGLGESITVTRPPERIHRSSAVCSVAPVPVFSPSTWFPLPDSSSLSQFWPSFLPKLYWVFFWLCVGSLMESRLYRVDEIAFLLPVFQQVFIEFYELRRVHLVRGRSRNWFLPLFFVRIDVQLGLPSNFFFQTFVVS